MIPKSSRGKHEALIELALNEKHPAFVCRDVSLEWPPLGWPWLNLFPNAPRVDYSLLHTWASSVLEMPVLEEAVIILTYASLMKKLDKNLD